MHRTNSPQLRFLLRGSILLIAMLALWWLLLLHPMLAGLRICTDGVLWVLAGGNETGSATIGSNGDWILRVPIPESLGRRESVQLAFGHMPGTPPVKVRSFRLAIASRIPAFFTLSFPLFWAMMIAGPRSKKFWGTLGIGTGILALLALVSLLFYTVYTIQNNMRLTSGLPATLWNGAEYLNVNVIPYMAPILLGLWLHRELRAQIFSWDAPLGEPAKLVAAATEKAKRGRYR